MKPCKTVHPTISMRLNMFKHAVGSNHPASYTLLAGTVHTADWNRILAASSHCAAPYTHRAAKHRAQPVRRYATLSTACTALHSASLLHIRCRAHRTTPCTKIKIFLFFQNTARAFPVSVRCCPRHARRMHNACTVDTVH